MPPELASEQSNETIVATYDRLAGLYDAFVSPLESGTRDRALDGLDIARGECAAEIGCGPGHGLVALADRVGSEGHVVGLDAAPRMTARARTRAVRRGVSERVDVLLGDARQLPLRDDAVDVAFVEDTLELFSTREMALVLAELARVMTADGRLGVVTMERSGYETDPFVRTYEWVFEHVPGYDRFGCRPVNARATLEQAGFEIERQERHSRGHV